MQPLLLTFFFVAVPLEAEFKFGLHFYVVYFPAMFTQLDPLFKNKHQAFWPVTQKVLFFAVISQFIYAFENFKLG